MAPMLALWWRWRFLVALRRREAEAARQLSVELGALTRYANDPVLVFDADQNIAAANDRAAMVLGYEHEDLLRLKSAPCSRPPTGGYPRYRLTPFPSPTRSRAARGSWWSTTSRSWGGPSSGCSRGSTASSR